MIRSYTYAKIDAVDDDLSTTLKNRDASVELSLVDINGDSLGNGDYYDDYNSDEKVLNLSLIHISSLPCSSAAPFWLPVKRVSCAGTSSLPSIPSLSG